MEQWFSLSPFSPGTGHNPLPLTFRFPPPPLLCLASGLVLHPLLGGPVSLPGPGDFCACETTVAKFAAAGHSPCVHPPPFVLVPHPYPLRPQSCEAQRGGSAPWHHAGIPPVMGSVQAQGVLCREFGGLGCNPGPHKFASPRPILWSSVVLSSSPPSFLWAPSWRLRVGDGELGCKVGRMQHLAFSVHPLLWRLSWIQTLLSVLWENEI